MAEFTELEVTVEGHTYVFPDDLTLEESEALEKTLGCTWLEVQPIVHASHCRAVLLAFTARTLDWEKATEQVAKMTQAQAIECFNMKTTEVPAAPKDPNQPG